MKKRAILVLAIFILLLAPFSGYVDGKKTGGGSGADGNKVYYDGKITVTTKGTSSDGSTFNENTTITVLKIEHWNVMPGVGWQGYNSGTGDSAKVVVNDTIGSTNTTYSGTLIFNGGQISLDIAKSTAMMESTLVDRINWIDRIYDSKKSF